MNTRHLMAGLTALALTISGGALADGIYKWIDEDGSVHYGDRPSGEPTEERLQMSYNRTSSSAVQSRVQSRRDAQAARETARTEAATAAATAADERAAAEEKVAKCQETRGKLKQMLEARRVYREDEDGERQYLDDAARAEARTKAEELITEYCG